jgi:hypothetical protein
MALVPVPKPEFPDVPRSDGVPSVFRDPTEIVFTILLLKADVLTVLRLFEAPQWGIFAEDGKAVAIPDSVISLDFRREWRISDYPLEKGAFESYDKVSIPYDARVRMSCDGRNTPRSLFLSQIDTAANSLKTYVITTPDETYRNANIIHYDYARKREGGVGILQVDVWLQEIRITVSTQFSATKAPEGAAEVNTGAVQPATPTPAQKASVALPKPQLPVPPIPPGGASPAGILPLQPNPATITPFTLA